MMILHLPKINLLINVEKSFYFCKCGLLINSEGLNMWGTIYNLSLLSILGSMLLINYARRLFGL